MIELYLLVIIAGIFGSAFFSASETAVLTTQIQKIEKTGEKRPHCVETVRWILAHRDRIIAALLIGNNLALVVVSAMTTSLLRQWFEVWHVEISTILITGVILLFGEIIPKSLALNYGTSFLLSSGWLLKLLSRVFSPLIFLLNVLPQTILRITGTKSDGPNLSRDQLQKILQNGRYLEGVTAEQHRVISRLMEFGAKKVVSALVPMADVVVIDSTASIRTAASLVHQSGYSRIPVFSKNSDHIVGVLHAVDLMGSGIDVQSVSDIMRAPVFVPEQQKVTELLPDLWHSGLMAIVVDEYGIPSGIVTTEDLLEEVMGDIYDEYDGGEVPSCRNLADGVYLIDGAMTIGEFNLRIADILPDGPYDTVAGFILNHIQKIPDRAEKFIYSGFEMVILESTQRRIVRVLVRRHTAEETHGANTHFGR